MNLSEDAKELKRQYFREYSKKESRKQYMREYMKEYRKNNTEKCKEIQARYWENKVKQSC